MEENIQFSSGTVRNYYSPFSGLSRLVPANECIILTDSNIAPLYEEALSPYRKIILPAGEQYKTLDSISLITEELISLEAHRKTWLVGVGGGMITDITGFAAAIYMRGVQAGYIPTTLLAMVDAAIGGKNGIDFGLHKNILGTIRQPAFILQDTTFLQTLPDAEWSNGFAEIIKYACLFDAPFFHTLEENSLDFYKKDKIALNSPIARCCAWKNKIVVADEQETGQRKLLNFGHTAGHAIETIYNIPHGQAVGIGMLIACMVSEEVNGLPVTVRSRLAGMLKQYGLPDTFIINADTVMDVLRMDKKRNSHDIDFIVLEDIGKGAIKTLPFSSIHHTLTRFADAGNH